MLRMITRLFRNKFMKPQQVNIDSDGESNRLLSLQKSYLPEGIFPNMFSINLGAAPCIHSCLFCPQSVEKPKKQWLDVNVLKKCLHEMPEDGIQLNVSSYSETMLAPNLFESLALMKKIRPKLPIALASSGISITEEQVHKLIDLELDIFQFSFDAPDKDSYKRLMQSDDYDKAVEKLDMIVSLRNARNSKMKIITHIMAFESQLEKYDEFKTKWEKKLDNVSLRQVANWGDDGLGLNRQLEEAGFVGVYKKPRKRYPCTSVFMHFKLATDGCYYPCVAYIPGKESEHSSYMLGDAREISFKEAWEKLELHRKKQLSGQWDDCYHCSTCDIWGLWENMFFEKNGVFSLDRGATEVTRWN